MTEFVVNRLGRTFFAEVLGLDLARSTATPTAARSALPTPGATGTPTCRT
jgi:hypothetical protein